MSTIEVFRANAERNHQAFHKDTRSVATRTGQDLDLTSGQSEAQKQAQASTMSTSTTAQSDVAKIEKTSLDYTDGWLRLN